MVRVVPLTFRPETAPFRISRPIKCIWWSVDVILAQPAPFSGTFAGTPSRVLTPVLEPSTPLPDVHRWLATPLTISRYHTVTTRQVWIGFVIHGVDIQYIALTWVFITKYGNYWTLAAIDDVFGVDRVA